MRNVEVKHRKSRQNGAEHLGTAVSASDIIWVLTMTLLLLGFENTRKTGRHIIYMWYM